MTEHGPAEGWRTKIWPFPRPTPAPPPAPAPSPAVPEAAKAKWLKAWLLLRQIDTTKLRAVFAFVPMVVFLAISGLLAWVWLALRGLWKFLKSVVS